MSFLPSPISMNCTVPSPWTRLKTSGSSSRPSPPHSSTLHCKILCYISATHALCPITSYCPLIWILVPLRDALKTSNFRLSLPAISHLQSKISHLRLPCHLMQKFPQHGTVSGIKADIRDPVLHSSQTDCYRFPNMCSIICHHITTVYATPSAWNALSFLLNSAYQVELSILEFSSKTTSLIKPFLISYTDTMYPSFEL